MRTCSLRGSSSSKGVLDLDDDEQDRLFAAAVKSQEQQQQQTRGAAEAPNVVDDDEVRRERTRQFLRVIVDVGVVLLEPDASASGSGALRTIPPPAEAVQTVRDMITAAVKLGTLRAHHIRRMFALCGERQREDPGREMWIRMLTVVKTTVDAERDRFFDRHSLYRSRDGRDGDEQDEDSPAQKVEESAVEPRAWNALLGLCLEYVAKKQAASGATTTATATVPPSRAVLESELDIVLGGARADQPHWYIVAEMDRRGVVITNEAALRFLEAEVRGGDGADSSKAEPKREPQLQRSAELKPRPDVRKSVLDSRVQLVNRMRDRR